jgi:hypothetical protein
MAGAIFKKYKVVLNNTRFKTLGSDPLILAAAPGPNNALNIVSATLSVVLSSGYTTGGNQLQIFVGAIPSSFVCAFSNGMLTGAGELAQIVAGPFNGNDDIANIENQAIYLSTDGFVDFTGGADDNTIVVEAFCHAFNLRG